MKFIKPFYGCRAGEIYPEHFAVGDECPPELEAAAIDTDSVEPDEAAPPAPQPAEPQPEPPAAEAPEKAKPGKKAEK